MSTPPPGASPPAMPPPDPATLRSPAAITDGDQTRGAHLAAIRRTQAFRIGTPVAALVGLGVGIASGTAAAIVLIPVIVVAVAFGIAFAMADSRAEEDFWTAFAASVGMEYVGDTSLSASTPLLGAGDRRNWSRWLQGPLVAGTDDRFAGLGLYTYEVRHTTTDSKGHTRTTYEPHHFTICRVDLSAGAPLYRGVFLRRKRFLDSIDRDWMSLGLDKVELESAEFADRFTLRCSDDQDPIKLRELFAPEFMTWLLDAPLSELGFEYVNGVLVVYVEHHDETAAGLMALRTAAQGVVAHIQREIDEAAAAS